MYLNYFSEHPMSAKKSIPYSQFLRPKRIHSEPQYLLEAQIHKYSFFIWREYPHDIILRAWIKTNEFTRKQLLASENNEDRNIPFMFITTYSRANPNFKELFSKHWAYLGRLSATREFGGKDFMMTYRKPPYHKDMLVGAKIAQPRTTTYKGCKRPNACKYCKKISHQGKSKTYTTINPTVQSLKALARVITWYIAWNATGATPNI